jgi:hypothetical protein
MLDKLKHYIRKAIAWLFSSDERTWLGHGLWGLSFGLILGWSGWVAPLMFTLGAFTFRELDDLISHVYVKKDRSLEDSLRDGWGDWVFPLVGVVIGILIWMI